MQGVGGIVGTSFDTVSDCTAVADIMVLGDDGACAGVVVGGTNGGSLINCTATGGSVTATGNSCWRHKLIRLDRSLLADICPAGFYESRGNIFLGPRVW